MENEMRNLLTKHREGKLICQKCYKTITDVAFIVVCGQIVSPIKVDSGVLFSCPEHAKNYSKAIIMHSICWIQTLREHGTELYDMKKVKEKYNKEKKNGMGKNNSD